MEDTHPTSVEPNPEDEPKRHLSARATHASSGQRSAPLTEAEIEAAEAEAEVWARRVNSC